MVADDRTRSRFRKRKRHQLRASRQLNDNVTARQLSSGPLIRTAVRLSQNSIEGFPPNASLALDGLTLSFISSSFVAEGL